MRYGNGVVVPGLVVHLSDLEVRHAWWHAQYCDARGGTNNTRGLQQAISIPDRTRAHMAEIAVAKTVNAYWTAMGQAARAADVGSNVEVKWCRQADADLKIPRRDLYPESVWYLVTDTDEVDGVTDDRAVVIRGRITAEWAAQLGVWDDFGNGRPPLLRVSQDRLEPLTEMVK